MTYGMHGVFSFPSCMKVSRCRSTPPCARPLVLCAGKQHAVLSPAASVSPECTLQRGTRQARGSLAKERGRTLPVLSHSERVDTQGGGGLAGTGLHLEALRGHVRL